MSGLVAVVATGLVAALALLLLYVFPKLIADMWQAEHDARDERARAWRYGGSLSWNDEGPAQVGGRPVSDATRSRKG